MKKSLIVVALLAVAGSAIAQQITTSTEKDVRNPKKLVTIINANATDAESRLTSGSTVASSLTLNNTGDGGAASVVLQSDKSDDAGDKMGLSVAGDGTGLVIQSDKSSKGTLATKASVSDEGLISTLVGIDAIGAVDMDYGSADVTDHTFTSDGGVVILDGSVTADNDLVAADDATVGDDLTVTGLATVGETLAVTGESTFTGKTIHNLGIDADYITVDAGAGIDNASAGALKIGESTATSVEIADVGVATAVEGALTVASTLGVTGNSTLGGTLAVTGASTLTGAATLSGAASVRGATTLNSLSTTGALLFTQGALVGVSTTNKFYSVAFAGEANCVTTTIITVNGIVVTGSSTL